jgi:hypothetical protein
MVFLFSVFPQNDRDQGWHAKYGEYFFQHGKLLSHDIFSWTLPGYAWVNHSWLYDIVFYVLTKITGSMGLSLISALLCTVTFFFIIRSYDLNLWQKGILAVCFIFLTEVVIGSGLRSQIVSMALFGILFWILIQAKERWNILWWLPPLFLLWTNLHGDFTIGIGIVAVFLICYFFIDAYREGDLPIDLFWLFSKVTLLCFIATLVNPYGYQTYLESFRHAQNPYLQNVLEWDPVFDGCASCHPHAVEAYVVLFGLCIVIAAWKRDWDALPHLLLFVILLSPMWHTRRLLPIFLLATLPVIAKTLTYIDWDLRKLKIAPMLVLLMIGIGLEFNLYNRFTVSHLYHFTEEDYCNYGPKCSVKATQYLLTHPPVGKGFTFYDWGGYLIGKNFPSRLFVDGRMHVWVDDQGYQPFADYIGIYYQNRDDIFRKYDFDWVLIPNGTELANKLANTEDLGKWKADYYDDQAIYLVRVRK